MGNLALILFSVLLTACGVRQDLILSEGIQDKGLEVEKELVYFSGEVPLTDESSLDLEDLKDKPTVLMFAGFLCSTCAEEVELLRNSLSNQNAAPSQVNLVSVVVGEDKETAQGWKEGRKVPWTVGYDIELQLFKRYCGNSQTPCTLVQTPEQGIVYKHVGATSVETLKSFTGPWELP